MAHQDDLRLAIRQAYADSPVPEHLTAAAQALIDGKIREARVVAPASVRNIDQAPATKTPRKSAVLAAALIAAAVAAVAIVTTSLTAPRSDRDASPTVTTQRPTSALPTSSTTAASAQTGTNTDTDLLRAMAIGTIVQPGAGAPTDSSSTADEPQWSFTRSRTVAAPIKDVITWYETNLTRIGASQPLTRGTAALYPAEATPELAAASERFVGAEVIIRFTATNSDTTRVDVVATGAHREQRPDDTYIPSDEITAATLAWVISPFGKPSESHSQDLDLAAAQKLVGYLNQAPLTPVMTYSGAPNGTTYNMTFNTQDGRTYTAHWDSRFAGAGVTLELAGTGSQLVDPDQGFYELLRQLTK